MLKEDTKNIFYMKIYTSTQSESEKVRRLASKFLRMSGIERLGHQIDAFRLGHLTVGIVALRARG